MIIFYSIFISYAILIFFHYFLKEREVVKKLTYVRKDHEKRLLALEATQELDKKKAELITRNEVSYNIYILISFF